jgi:hypothetical protein
MPRHDSTTRKYVAHNLHLSHFTFPREINYAVFPSMENTKQLRKNYPFSLPQNTSPYLCINFTMIKCHNMAGHPQPYPDTWGPLGLRSTNR